jgi:hypothetical protein
LKSELRLELHIVEPTGGGRTLNALGSHLSPEGIFVQLADPPPIGTRVGVTVADAEIGGALTAEGLVVDRVVLDQESDRTPGVGIRLEQTGAGWHKLYQWLLDDSTE